MFKKFFNYMEQASLTRLQKELDFFIEEIDPQVWSNGYQISKINIDTTFLEAEGFQFPSDSQGGMIVFSNEVNAVVDRADSKRGKYADTPMKKIKQKIKNFTRKTVYTALNKIKEGALISKAFDALEKVYGQDIFRGITIGNGFKGVYEHKSKKNGKETITRYSEKSKTITIAGMDTPTLIKFASAIANYFKQEEVLLYDYNDQKIKVGFVNRKFVIPEKKK
jgi:hypothetical protein